MNQTADQSREEKIANFLGQVMDYRNDPNAPRTRGAGRIGAEYWADAPWRLEPDQTEIPLTFIARDAVDKRLDSIEVSYYSQQDQENDLSKGKGTNRRGKWKLWLKFNGPGEILQQYWYYQPLVKMPRPPEFNPQSDWPAKGKEMRLKVVFRSKRKTIYKQYLVILMAKDHLPLRDSSQWFYGDTHYHSIYTNDLIEFGNPIPDTSAAAKGMGLDWLIVTDHSVDLENTNPAWEGQNPKDRWDTFCQEVKNNSSDKFRILIGEEVTVMGRAGKGTDIIHVLVFGGNFTKMIPGAFWNIEWLDDVLRWTFGSRERLSYLFGKIYNLPEVLTGKDKHGNPVSQLDDISVQAQHAMACAAHPASDAQGPYGTWEIEDLMHPIDGMEAWNTRTRKKTGKEENPFNKWKKFSKGESKERKAIDRWDQVLRLKVNNGQMRCVLLAGSDAHGSFNYTTGLTKSLDLVGANDNCMGKVRSLLYFPNGTNGTARKVPTEEDIFNAIKTGSFVVTDGPVVNFTLSFNGKTATLGQIMEDVDGEGTLEVNVQAASTHEFGLVEKVRVFYYFKGMENTECSDVDFEIGKTEMVIDSMQTGTGYIRLETETHNGEESFRCVTNPIWVRPSRPAKCGLLVKCVEW